jgi:predicted nucleic acid-binding protein
MTETEKELIDVVVKSLQNLTEICHRLTQKTQEHSELILDLHNRLQRLERRDMVMK